jgi:RNA polymerase sigma factor (sigma-70 family)
VIRVKRRLARPLVSVGDRQQLTTLTRMLSDTADSGGMALLVAWQEGDRAAGNAFVDRHFAAVYRFLRRRVDDAAAAKDLAQRTFLACLEAGRNFAPTAGVRVYVLGIARNILMHHFRDARTLPPGVGEREPSLTTPSRAVARTEERMLVRSALATLPELFRVVLELHYWDELSVASIAAMLDAPIGTIKWRMHRGRDLLRMRIAAAAVPEALQHATLSHLDHWARTSGPESAT